MNVYETSHSANVGWGDNSPIFGKQYTDLPDQVVVEHTYKKSQCFQVAILFGQWNPYCGEGTHLLVFVK